MKRLLIVEDDLGLRESLAVALEGDYELSFAGDTVEAEACLASESVQAMLLDERLPGRSGTDWLLERRPKQHPPVILVSANADPAMAVKALRLGAVDCIAKPFDLMELKARLAALLQSVQGLPLGGRAEPFALRSAKRLSQAWSSLDEGQLVERVAVLQEDLVRDAMRTHEGNLVEAARCLKIDPAELELLLRLMAEKPGAAPPA